MTDFVVVGFPKCGTSALIRMLEGLKDVVVERNGNDLEAPFYMTKASCEAYEASRRDDPSRIFGHKHAPYIYQPSAIKRIAERNPTAVFIVCVRDPMKSLVSWREMHRQIAVKGAPNTHFVNRDATSRSFFSEGSLAQYYRDWARDRLQYARHLKGLMSLTEGHRLVIVEQAAMAVDPDFILELLATEIGAPPPQRADRPTRRAHVGHADRTAPLLDDDIRRELEGERAALYALLDDLQTSGRAVVIRLQAPEQRAGNGASLPPVGAPPSH